MNNWDTEHKTWAEEKDFPKEYLDLLPGATVHDVRGMLDAPFSSYVIVIPLEGLELCTLTFILERVRDDRQREFSAVVRGSGYWPSEFKFADRSTIQTHLFRDKGGVVNCAKLAQAILDKEAKFTYFG
jgi:hypothetical protein